MEPSAQTAPTRSLTSANARLDSVERTVRKVGGKSHCFPSVKLCGYCVTQYECDSVGDEPPKPRVMFRYIMMQVQRLNDLPGRN